MKTVAFSLLIVFSSFSQLNAELRRDDKVNTPKLQKKNKIPFDIELFKLL